MTTNADDDLDTDYADWKAPREDGQTLIWPSPQAILDDARATQALLARADTPPIQGVPLMELRRRMRAFAGHPHDEQPLLVTGHQTELHHPGVWAKNALIDAAARAIAGRAMHLAVDTDQPKHLQLRWPGFTAPITDDSSVGSADWATLLAPPTPAHLAALERSAQQARPAIGAEPVIGEFFDAMRHAALDGHEGTVLPNALTMAMQRLDWSLGLDYQALTLSPMLMSTPWLTFAHHLLADAEEFGVAYNNALAGYRTAHNIPGRTRPMPDLVFTSGGIESPLWLDELATGRRHRAAVERRNGKLFLHKPYEDDAFEFDASLEADEAARRLQRFLTQHQLRLAPRALTLTTFLRLFLADLFVHGIGGGRYDQVTDALLADYFGVVPPPFAVTTATLYLPRAAGRTRACVPCVLQEGHRLKHNLLGEEKRELVGAIATAPRRSPRRQELFFNLHRRLRTARESTTVLQTWQQRLEQTRADAAEDAVIFDREVFYALQPRERLVGLIERYRDSFSRPL